MNGAIFGRRRQEKAIWTPGYRIDPTAMALEHSPFPGSERLPEKEIACPVTGRKKDAIW